VDQQHWQDPASPAPTAPALPANLEHGSRDAEAWAATPWAVVTATGIVQARCGQPTPTVSMWGPVLLGFLTRTAMDA
jgi:hypothetical protein